MLQVFKEPNYFPRGLNGFLFRWPPCLFLDAAKKSNKLLLLPITEIPMYQHRSLLMPAIFRKKSMPALTISNLNSMKVYIKTFETLVSYMNLCTFWSYKRKSNWMIHRKNTVKQKNTVFTRQGFTLVVNLSARTWAHTN